MLFCEKLQSPLTLHVERCSMYYLPSFNSSATRVFVPKIINLNNQYLQHCQIDMFYYYIYGGQTHVCTGTGKKF